jgi:glycolate oxidase FAD binding subunit
MATQIDSRLTFLPTVAGLTETVEPSTPDAVAEVLATCARENRVVVPVGGGCALPLGNLTEPDALALKTGSLNRIRSYESTDMTLSVEAGVSLSEIQRVLGERGQMIPIEAPEPETATIGGLLATALTGPRRYGGGTLRDVLIGIEVAYPDGTVGKAGGMVVKNVSGFDLMRLHHGALGTLGVITSANFKVLARPRAELTYVTPVPDLEAARALSDKLRPLADRPVALVIRSIDSSITISARYEGRESGLNAVRTRVGDVLAGGMVLAGADSADYWQDLINERQLDQERTWRLQIGCRPSESFDVSRAVIDLAGPGVRAEIEPGIGSVLIATDGILDLAGIQAVVGDAIVRVLDAPLAVRTGIDVWGAQPGTIDLMRRLKHEFDPSLILNRGRFAGHI